MEKHFEHKMCVLIFSATLSQTFLTLTRIQRDTVTNVHRSCAKQALSLSDFHEN